MRVKSGSRAGCPAGPPNGSAARIGGLVGRSTRRRVDPRAPLVLDAPPAEDGAPGRVRLFVYQRNVERAAGSLEALEAELTSALEREVTGAFLEGQQPDKSQLN